MKSDEMTIVGGPRAAAERLWATSAPLPEESCASWIQRVAGNHQYSMPLMMRLFMYEPKERDWDLPMPCAVWARITTMAAIEGTTNLRALRVLRHLAERIDPERLLLQGSRRPCYRWCACCLASDPIPYLRWHWRLTTVRQCWVHRVPLLLRCPSCGVFLSVYRARLVAKIGGGGLAATLADCDHCGMPLHAGGLPRAGYNPAAQARIRHVLRVFRQRRLSWTEERLAYSVGCFAAAASLGDALLRSVQGRDWHRLPESEQNDLPKGRASRMRSR
jgi:hypothetical protein